METKHVNHRFSGPRRDVGMPGGQFMSIATAKAMYRPAVKEGYWYVFYSSMENSPPSPTEVDYPMFTGQEVWVYGQNPDVDEFEVGKVFKVRTKDGTEFEAYEDELNGWCRDTGQFFEPIPE